MNDDYVTITNEDIAVNFSLVNHHFKVAVTDILLLAEEICHDEKDNVMYKFPKVKKIVESYKQYREYLLDSMANPELSIFTKNAFYINYLDLEADNILGRYI